MKIALLGFGTVGGSVVRILTERPELADRITLTHIFNRDVARKRAPWVSSSVTWTDDIDDVLASAPDVVVEAVGGLRPAGEWVRRALERGVSVVTANKMLIATEGPALLHVARSTGAQLRFEAAVCGGVPLIHAVRDGLAGDTLTGITGIVNGTSNYVLSRMAADGDSMDAVLDDARRLGYAEADPSADIDGDDAAAKLVVLAAIAFGRHLPFDDITRQSIRSITTDDFAYANRLGCTIRQVAHVEAIAGGRDVFEAFVGPVLVPVDSALGRAEGVQNVVCVRGCYGGITTFSGEGAGGAPTAVAVVSDLLALQQGNGSDAEIPAPGRVIPATGAFTRDAYKSAAPLALPMLLGV